MAGVEELWHNVDEYFAQHLAPHDDALAEALAASVRAGLPPISVTATQGKFLQMLATLCDAHRILEIGTLGGYSTIWMARALTPGGSVVTLEIDPKHALVASENIRRAGLTHCVDILVGPAVKTLKRLAAQKDEPFDLVFIDADKANSDVYFSAALDMSRPGAVIVVDNVVREGAVVESDSSDESVAAIRRVTELMARESRISATAVQTVGSKGYDGFIIAVVGDDVMPFKSKAQRRKFAELLVAGDITPEAYERWNRETGRAELPERAKPKAKRKRRSVRKKSVVRKKRSAARKQSPAKRPAKARRKTTRKRRP